jgi:hypothetical protein
MSTPETGNGAEGESWVAKPEDMQFQAPPVPSGETDRLTALRAVAAEHPVAGPNTVRRAVAEQEQSNVVPIKAEVEPEDDQAKPERLQPTG